MRASVADAWWPRAPAVEPIDVVLLAAEHLEKGEPVPAAAAVQLARALRMYLSGSTDITANLGLRPRPGGRYEAPIASQSMRARNDGIKRLFHLQKGSNSVRAEKVAALLRAEPGDGAVTEEEMLGYAMRLHAEFGGTLPTSARQVLRVVLPGT